MKTFKLSSLVLAAAATFLFTACDKDDDTPELSKTDLLTNAEWKGSDILYEGVSHKDSTWVDINGFRMKFNPNGSYNITDLDGDADTGNWNFINNETQLVIDGDTNNIKVLTKDNLNLESAEPRSGSTPAEFEIRLVH